MQQLHLVGFTTDHTGLIFSPRRNAKSGGYYIVADEKLMESIREAQRLRDGGDPAAATANGEGGADAAPPTRPPKPMSSLSPREIQARLRAGGTVAEIAAAAGVDEEWILRFADPIRAEQARVVEHAQRLTFNKPRLGMSSENLETSVRLNLAERGVGLSADVFGSAWTAFNLHGTTWAVRFTYTSRQRRQSAQWEVELRTGELGARNRLASDLAYVEPGRRRRRAQLVDVAPEEPPARRRASVGKGRAAAAIPVSRKPAGKGGTKRLPAPKKTPAAAPGRKPAARETTTRARRPAKKPPAESPGREDRPGPVPGPPPAPPPERPTHLARPPSPMSPTNRAVKVPGRLVGAPSLRPPLPPRPRPRPAPRPVPPRAAEQAAEAPPDAAVEPELVPEPEAPAEPAPEHEPGAEAGAARPAPRAASRRGERRIKPRTGDRPEPVVILSTPAVRRLEPKEEPAADEQSGPSS